MDIMSIAIARALSGNGGGAGGSNIFIVNATFAFDSVEEEWYATLDKTFAEISAAANAGKIVLCIPYESASGIIGYPCVMTVESTEAYASTDVDANDGTVYSFSFGIDNNDDTYVDAITWSKGGGGVLVVNVDEYGVLDKTWQEIHDAFVSRGVVIDKGKYQNVATGVGSSKGEFTVSFATQPNWNPGYFITDSADGYPATE